ncbi:iron chelate uptake ABC transporter family permease subunit [Alkalicoccus luteus]|uniref:Iron chelate uptake ABC transporter family permease subunit n=1 Tax=Alkalicoccus luteus TaxID=1237094 RepID=A0A969PPK1_9BACI|nr:iron chelate uptake ABC transporter family permease subunit [Alkalicoccus luteus]NJP38022.1 iron chelate uptake ABC transporter family permease subunit [Alkalicoccus luteus]
MDSKWKLMLIASLVAVLSILFLMIGADGNWEYVLPRRGRMLAAFALTGAAIAYSTIVFQTITGNRILTPNIIGLDSLYLLIQTFIIFVFGSLSYIMVQGNINFLLSTAAMIGFSFLFYKLLFQGEKRQLYFLLLVGFVLGTFFSSLSTFMQVLMDPNEFQNVQNRMFASFQRVQTDLLLLTGTAFAGLAFIGWRWRDYLDVLALGKDHAVNLGVAYDRIVRRLLILVAALISIATALVGPIMFLGLLVANVTYEMMRTHEHRWLLPAGMLTGMGALILGQIVVEHVFTFSTTLSVIINFIGGVYFLWLILKERKA